MINLDKEQNEQQPSQAEMELFVKRIYEYAFELYRQNKSWPQIKEALMQQGLDSETADHVIANLRTQIDQEKSSGSTKELLFGFLLVVVGGALTYFTSGRYIFYGAVLYGIWLILKGIYHKLV